MFDRGHEPLADCERRDRVKQPEIRRFVELRSELTVVMDSRSVTDAVSNILPPGRELLLSAYDGAYLDVTMRQGASLATSQLLLIPRVLTPYDRSIANVLIKFNKISADRA